LTEVFRTAFVSCRFPVRELLVNASVVERGG
jgi:hypothetical protein